MDRNDASDSSREEPRLDDRIVELLQREPGALAFNGLRRTLEAHPESLVRALRRLERLGVVARGERGYELVGESEAASPTPDPGSLRTIGSVDLAPGVGREELLGQLAGRWFADLRWVGVYERPGEPLLVWSFERGDGHVLLGVRRGRLRVLVDRPRDPDRSDPLGGSARNLLARALARLNARPEVPSPPVVGFARIVAGPSWAVAN